MKADMFPKRITTCSALVLAILMVAARAGAAGWIELSGTPATATYHDVYFIDANNGFIVGEDGSGNGVILRTTNGGNAFTDWVAPTVTGATLNGAPLWNIFFLDSNNGWVVGEHGTIKYTSDSGANWDDYSTSGLTGTEPLHAVFFSSVDKGWVATYNETIGGAVYVKPDALTDWSAAIMNDQVGIRDLVFLDSNHGFASGYAITSTSLLESTDGGNIWNLANIGALSMNYVYKMAMVNSNELWVTGVWVPANFSSLLLYNGSAWSAPGSVTSLNLSDIDFVGSTSDDGWAVGPGSTIQIRSGGAAWVTESTTATSDLEGVAAIDTLNAFAVGTNGVILRRGCSGDPECDDGLYCTGMETCSSGVCTHAGDPCLTGSECDNVCNEGAGNCNVVSGTACTDDGNVCTDDQCDGTGSCGHPANSASCDDGLYCNGSDTCSGGVCNHSGDPCLTGSECDNVCDDMVDNCHAAIGTGCTDDGNLCTDDQCDGAGACGHPANSASCDDGLFCNGTDSCSGGTCSVHVGDPCLTGPECANVCNEGAGNCNVVSGTACADDGNVCTDDQCDGTGTCGHPANSASCDDGLYCTGVDSCSGGVCNHTGDPCLGGPECDNVCDDVADNCNAAIGTGCTDDGNVCTDDQCDGAGTCGHPANSASCDDGLYCTGVDSCSGGVCNHTGDPCLGGPECDNVCDDVADNCNAAIGTGCTDDGNLCTDDQCDGAGACGHSANSLPCDDGLFCNGTDSCSAGACSVHVGDPCLTGPECANVCNEGAGNCNVISGTACTDDGNLCTDDQCDGTGACGHPANSANCDDGLYCNGVDACSGGVCNHTGDPCLGGPECDNVCDDVADNCHVSIGTGCTDDGNVCTDDQCDGAGACGHPANSASCDDGLYCNGVDSCSGGVCNHTGDPCSGGPECDNVCDDMADNCHVAAGTSCTDDGNVCTDDQCDGAGACGHPVNSASCDDGLYCTVNDRCSGGLCSGDDNDCSSAAGPCRYGYCHEDTDSCSVGDNKPPGTDCEPCGQCDGLGTCTGSAARDGDECDDGDTCTGTGTCLLAGTCQIEGWCDVIVDPDSCDAPAAVYAPDSPDCRFADDKVELTVEVGSNIPQQGGFIPVRIWLSNSPTYSLTGERWSKPLGDLSVVLTLNSVRTDEKQRRSILSYLLGSAVLQAGELALEEQPDPSTGQVRFLLATDDALLPNSAGWMLDLTLVYDGLSGSDATFDVTVTTPCGAEPDMIGCHSDSGWQPVSKTIMVGSSGGDYQKDSLELKETPRLGCECGSTRGTGQYWLLLLLVLLIWPRRHPR